MVEAHLVRVDHLIVVLVGILHLSQQRLLIPILQRRRTRKTRTQGKNFTVRTLQLVSIAWHIRAGTDEAHLSPQHIPQFR